MLERKDLDGVVQLRMAHGKANLLDVDFLTELIDALAELESDSRVGAVVLTGRDDIFSAGVDLFQILDGGEQYLADFMPRLVRAFTDLFRFPRPLVAAANGHAIAGGAVLLSTADFRSMAEGKGRVGVPELRVGVPFPGIGLGIVRHAVSASSFQRLILRGETVSGGELQRLGWVDEIVPAADLLERATEVARELATIPARTFRLAKEQMRRPVLEAYEHPDLEAEVREVWRSPEAHRAIRRYVEETLGR